MKILLINPNRYHAPPVPPIGLELVAGSLDAAGHESLIVDLCFSSSAFDVLDRVVQEFDPDCAGVTVRNVDTVLYHENEFFLDDIRAVISHLREKHGLRVIAGGAGIATNPAGVGAYLGADCAVVGQGESAMVELLDRLRSGDLPQVYRGTYRFEVGCPRKRGGIDYPAYFSRGGIAGFETHRGCGSSCLYCTEANTNVSFRRIPDVISGIRSLADEGWRRFHVCDSEFNEDPDFSIEFCSALKSAVPGIEWAAYMKPVNYNRKLLRLMKESGASLITLTVDSWKKCSLYWEDVEKIIFTAKSAGIRIVVDFLTGFPYEDDDTVKSCLDLFRRACPDRVGINADIRLYRSLKITEIITSDDSLKGDLVGHSVDPECIRPVFYRRLGREKLEELIGNDPLFRIEGTDKSVNYLRE